MKMSPDYSLVHSEFAHKSTVISIVPFPIIEEKPGLIPGHFEIEASDDGEPRCLVVGECIHFVWIDEVRGSLKVTSPSYQVAKSLVDDYVNSQLEARPDAYPGIFWVPEVIDAETAKVKYADRLAEMRRLQHNWFMALVKIGDDDWQKTRQHVAISDLQRYAARAIDPDNKAGRPWVFVNVQQEAITGPETVLCPACGSDIVKTAVICRYCQFIVDEERYANMQFAGRSPAQLAAGAIQRSKVN